MKNSIKFGMRTKHSKLKNAIENPSIYSEVIHINFTETTFSSLAFLFLSECNP